MKNNNSEIEKFVRDQLSCWPLACANFRALKGVKTKTLTVGGLDVTVQHNPARMISSAAKLDKASVAKRPCFFCNRFPEQTFIRFEGRKGKKYDILLNPYPIFPNHLVIAMARHCDQSIWKRYIDVLDLSKKYQGYTFFYNGPHSGASAPDHHHFQASPSGLMPLEADVQRMFSSLKGVRPEVAGGVEPQMEYLTSVQDAHLFHYGKYLNGIFALRAATSKSAAKLFYRLLDCADIPEGESEPLFNLISWYSEGEFRSVVVFRTSHRSHHYWSEGPDHLTMSPGCADMGGCVIAPVPEDFDKLDSALLTSLLTEVTLSPERQNKIIHRLTRTQPHISVGIMSAPRIEFQMYPDGGGTRVATFREGKIDYDGALYDELFFEEQTPSTFFAEPTFELHDVTIGKGFHWERKETQKFAGTLKIIVENNSLTAINIIGVEDYLLSVISSEMSQKCPLEFLKAHAVISRSWVMAQLRHEVKPKWNDADRESLLRCTDLVDVCTWLSLHYDAAETPSTEKSEARTDACAEALSYQREREYIKWYDNNDHKCFDVCADDHCQRYQGLTRATDPNVQKAVDDTWGQVLRSGGELCDARFSKCCGGVSELFSTCWADSDKPYLQALPDTPGHLLEGTPDAEGKPAVPFCSKADSALLSRIFNSYDQTTVDFYTWTENYGVGELSEIIEERSGMHIGTLTALESLAEGPSGRIFSLRVEGTEGSFIVGKELEIRRILSRTHLKSSAFTATFTPDGRVVLRGRGWGHGVGFCQIGAAVMALEGYPYREILAHYYPGAEVCTGGEVSCSGSESCPEASCSGSESCPEASCTGSGSCSETSCSGSGTRPDLPCSCAGDENAPEK